MTTMTTTTGFLTRVDALPLETTLAVDAAAGATTITVTDPVLDEEARPDTLSLLEIDETPYNYAAFDADTGTVTLLDPLPVDLEEGYPVRVLADDGAPVVEYWGQVSLDDPDAESVQARLTAAAGVMLSVVEDLDVPVLLQLVDDQWTIVDILRRDPVLDAELRRSDDTGNLAGGVDVDGNLSGRDLSYAGTFNADTISMLWDGVPAVEVLDLLPRGVIAWGSRTPLVKGIASQEYALLAMTVYVPRDCEAQIIIAGGVEASVDEARFNVRVRHTYDPDVPPPLATNGSPLLSSPFDGTGIVVTRQQIGGVAGSNNSFNVPIGTQLAAGWYNLRLTVSSDTAIMLNTIGEFALRVIDQGPALLANSADAPVAPGTLASGGTDTGPATDSEPSYFTRTYDATDTKWWSGGGTFKGAGDNQYFGNTSNTGEGNRKSVIWFPKDRIVRDLAGATVQKVELYLNLHDGGNGNVVAVGSHKDTTPGSNEYSDVTATNRQRQTFGGWNAGQARWLVLDFDRQDWKTPGQIAGVVIGPESNDSDKYAGGYRGATHPKGPQLRITYTR